MDGDAGIALQTILSQQTQLVQDMSALRSDIQRAVSHIGVIDERSRQADAYHADFETRIRLLEARPQSGDHEGRIRALERFRYTLAGLSVIGGAATALVGWLIGQAVHH